MISEEHREVLNGVEWKDEDIDTNEDDIDEVVVIGEVKLEENEIAIFRRHPEFAVYEKLSEIDMNIEVEKSMAKVRWDREKNG